MFSEIYLKDPNNIASVLELLEEQDFYIRFDVIQLLQALVNNAISLVQTAVLSSPLGLAKLADLLDEKREIIRNGNYSRCFDALIRSSEAILLIISLTESNADIQKIFAFQNTFERLLSIILEEGGVEGGIVTQDCLNALLNLLRYNTSNQVRLVNHHPTPTFRTFSERVNIFQRSQRS
jgi:hypothetical protein